MLTAGGVASGKSSFIRALQREKQNFVHIAGDRIKPQLPEFEQLKAEGRLGSDNPLNKEAGLIAQMALDEAQRRGLNIAYDSTFTGAVGRREAQLRSLLGNGYRVQLQAMDLPPEEAMARSALRSADSDLPEDAGRDESEEAIRRTNREAARNVLTLAHLPHEVRLYDNTGAEAAPVFARFAGAEPQVYDRGAYEAYQRKAATADE